MEKKWILYINFLSYSYFSFSKFLINNLFVIHSSFLVSLPNQKARYALADQLYLTQRLSTTWYMINKMQFDFPWGEWVLFSKFNLSLSSLGVLNSFVVKMNIDWFFFFVFLFFFFFFFSAGLRQHAYVFFLEFIHGGDNM